MQRPFLQTISPLSPRQMKSTFFRQTRSKNLERDQDIFKPRKKQVKSLLSIYAQKLLKTSQNHQKQSESIRKKDRLSLISKESDLLLYTIQNKNNKNSRVQSTIGSVNNYNQQLRITLINQYKNRKKAQLLKQKKKLQKQHVQRSRNERPEENPEVLNNRNPMLTKYSNQDLTFKTVNLLYQAIIDNTFHKRKKEQFQLRANKLPIINRNENKKKQLLINNQQAQKPQIQTRKTFLTIYRPQKDKQKKEAKIDRKIQRDDLDIIPWKSQDEQVEQN